MKKVLIILATLLVCQIGYSQSLLHSKPIDLNNGFAGAKKYDRISFLFNEISPESKNSYFSYDRLVKPLKGGIGFDGTRKQLTTQFNDKENCSKELIKVGLGYSPKIIISNSILISPSVSIHYAKLNTEIRRQVDEVSSLLITESNYKFIENSVGVLANSSIGYAGYELKSQFIDKNYFQHNFLVGYVHNVAEKRNILIDGVYRIGSLVDNDWRNYKSQINLAYNYGILYVGGGLNDQKYASALMGIRLINLKVTSAFHFIKPNNMSNLELGIQYTFNKNNKEKIVTPFKKWMIKLKM